MIQTIYKGTDLVFNIKLEDKDGIPFRVRNTSEFILRLYTTNPAEFIECSFKDGDLTGIIEEDRIDKAVINSSDLDKLQSGLIYYSYSFKSPNAMFNDAYYYEVVKGQTNYYLK